MTDSGMLYLDCFSGASGDMILGALIDLGLPLDALKAALGSLALEYGDVSAEKVSRSGVSATKFRLHDTRPAAPEGSHAHYHLKGVVNRIRKSSLSPEGQDRAVHLFERLPAAHAALPATPRGRKGRIAPPFSPNGSGPPRPPSTTRRSRRCIFTKSARSIPSSTSSARCTVSSGSGSRTSRRLRSTSVAARSS